MTDPAAACEDWRQGLDNSDLHIHARQRPPDSARELVLPPSPTSERPGYNLLYTTADTLNIDVLLIIFNHYRLDDEERWNTQLRWCKLSHVCRKWRYLIYESCLHLNIFIHVTNDTPSVDKLAHFPSLPLVIDYCSSSYTLVRSQPRKLDARYWTRSRGADTTEDDGGVLHAIQQRDRVRRIALEVTSSTLVQLIAPMDEPFPRLEALSLLSIENPGRDAMMVLTLPREFSAPNLRHLELRGIHLSKGVSFLASTLFLVTLKLTQIQSLGYFAPEDLVTQLQHIPKLEELSIGFSVPMSRASTEREPSRAQTTVTTLPSLKWLVFQGEATYLEGMIALISVPLLERLKITLFYEPSFQIPHLSELIKTAKGLGKPVAHVIFYDWGGASFVVGSRDELGDRSLKLEIRCNPFDQQVQSVTRLCSAFVPDLSITNLTLDFGEDDLRWDQQTAVGRVVAAVWRELLRPFKSVQKLHIHSPLLVEQLSDALGSDDAGSAPGLLPSLGELDLQMGGSDAFAAFISARERAGRPVRLSFPDVTLQWHQLSGLLQRHQERRPLSSLYTRWPSPSWSSQGQTRAQSRAPSPSPSVPPAGLDIRAPSPSLLSSVRTRGGAPWLPPSPPAPLRPRAQSPARSPSPPAGLHPRAGSPARFPGQEHRRPWSPEQSPERTHRRQWSPERVRGRQSSPARSPGRGHGRGHGRQSSPERWPERVRGRQSSPARSPERVHGQQSSPAQSLERAHRRQWSPAQSPERLHPRAPSLAVRFRSWAQLPSPPTLAWLYPRARSPPASVHPRAPSPPSLPCPRGRSRSPPRLRISSPQTWFKFAPRPRRLGRLVEP